MKRLIIAALLFIAAGMIDLKPIDLSTMQNQSISVMVDGAVQRPGYVKLEKYASEQEALNAAVPLANADLSGINPMTVLKDKDYIKVPLKQAEKEAVKVSINSGSLEQLMTLPGIGEGTAEKIISYRSEKGLFQSLEDLKQVTGIGDAKFEKLKDQITL
jgi:competence protein ComEA